MNIRKFCLAGAVASSLCFATARGELTWEKKELELHPAIGDANAVAVFKYQNKGDKQIHFNSVRTSCGCTVAALQKNDVAPGEKGEITATLKIGDRSGLQTKTVTVETDDPKEPSTILTLKAHITQLLEVQPPFIFWVAGEEPKPKTIVAKAGEGVTIKGLEVTSSSPDFTAKVEPGSAKGEFKINVQPKETKHAMGAQLTIKPDSASAPSKLFYATVQVTTPAPPPSAPLTQTPGAPAAALTDPPEKATNAPAQSSPSPSHQ